MKQYTIDELRYPDYEKIKKYLDDTYGASGVDGLYWMPVDEQLLSDVQRAHTSCAPFFMALELEEGRISGELLIRTRNRVRCDCIHYADERQRNWLIRQVESPRGSGEKGTNRETWSNTQKNRERRLNNGIRTQSEREIQE